MKNKKTITIILIIMVGVGIFLLQKQNINNKNISNNTSGCVEKRKIDFKLPEGEILSADIGVEGGVLQGKDDFGQWVTINIPKGALNKTTKIDLTFEEGLHEVKSGIKSSLTFRITPDIGFKQPLSIIVLYEKKYSCDKIKTIVPYLIEKNNKLKPAQLTGLYKTHNVFTMGTFHGGSYSWVYGE